MSVMPYNYDEDPITQETAVITPELADRISARIALEEPTPVQLLWVGLEQKATETRRWRTDVRGARKAARAQKRADDLHRTYLAVRKQPAEVGELDRLWSDYEDQVDKADELYERHETITRRRTTEMRIKAVAGLAGAAYATSYIGIPLRYSVLTFGAIGLAGAGILWLRSLYSLGTAQHRRHQRKHQRSAKPKPSTVSHLELVTDCAVEDEAESEPLPDWVQLFEDIMSVRWEGEKGAWTIVLVERLTDQFPDRYTGWDEDRLRDAINPVLESFRIQTSLKPRMKTGRLTAPRAGFFFDKQINVALQRAETA